MTRIEVAVSTTNHNVIMLSAIDQDGDAEVWPMTRLAASVLMEQLRVILATVEV
jgi:hypothetical protein